MYIVIAIVPFYETKTKMPKSCLGNTFLVLLCVVVVFSCFLYVLVGLPETLLLFIC